MWRNVPLTLQQHIQLNISIQILKSMLTERELFLHKCLLTSSSSSGFKHSSSFVLC